MNHNFILIKTIMMHKLLTTVLLAVSVSSAFAQKLDDVQKKISKGEYASAKESVDKFLADPKNQNNANAWFYKGKVYAELAKQDSTGTVGLEIGKEGFEAYKKYLQLDQKNLMGTLEQNVILFQLYDLYYNQGIKHYNAKEYPTAYAKMKAASEIEEFTNKKGFSYNGYSFPALDTQLVNLTASSAYLAKKQDEAMPYFERLADARLKDKEYKEVYALLAEHYLKSNETAKADKYLGLGKELFPDEEYWISLEFGDPGKDTAQRIAKYETMLQKYPNNYPLAMDYAIELFNYTYGYDGKKPADYAAREEKTRKALNNALAANPNSATANYVSSQMVYNQIYDLEDAIRAVRGTAAADVAKKKELNAKLDAKYDELFPYASKAFELYSNEPKLKGPEKVNLRKVTEHLVDYYTRKKQTDKVTFYQEKLKTF